MNSSNDNLNSNTAQEDMFSSEILPRKYFNDTLNTFYLLLYGVRNMVKKHLNNKKGNLLLPFHAFFKFATQFLVYQLWEPGWNDK